MNIINVILICCPVFFGVLGLVIGLVKGFTNVKSWANEYLIGAGLSVLIGSLVKNATSDVANGALIGAAITLGSAVVLLLLMMLLSKLIRSSLTKKIERSRQLSLYKQHDEIEEYNEDVLEAVREGDKKKYKQLSKQKFVQKSGGWRVVDRLLGAFTLAVKGLTIVGIIEMSALALLELTPLPIFEEFSGLFASDVWALLRPHVFDLLIVGLLFVCIRRGFSAGLVSSLWPLVSIALAVGAAFLAYLLAFTTTVFDSAALALSGTVGGWLGEYEGAFAWLTAENVARAIILAGIFVVLLVVVILIAVFVPRMIDKAREGASFRVIDGILGSVVATAIVLAVLLFLGNILQTVSSLDFMTAFNTYFEESSVAVYFYGNNVLTEFGFVPVDLSVWLS